MLFAELSNVDHQLSNLFFGQLSVERRHLVFPLGNDVVVSEKSICMDLQGIADRACTAGDPVIMLRSS